MAKNLSHLPNDNVQLITLTFVIDASYMEDTVTYTAAMTKQMKGFRYIQSETGKAQTYFEQAADMFCEIGMLLEMAQSKLGSAVLVYPDKPERAYFLLHECLDGFAKCGASNYIGLTKSLISRLTPTDQGLRQLTLQIQQTIFPLSFRFFV